MLRRLAGRPQHFVVAFVADEQNVVSLLHEPAHFQVHLGHQRACGIDHLQPAALGLGMHGRRHAMGAEDDNVAFRHLVQVVDEDDAARLETLHHRTVVDDFLAHVHRRRKELQRFFDDIDRPVDAGAETAWAHRDGSHL